MSFDYTIAQSYAAGLRSPIRQGCAALTVSNVAESWRFSEADCDYVFGDSAPSREIPSPDDLREFKRLAKDWRDQRRSTSSIREMVACPAYLRIINFGAKAIPLLLGELQRQPDFWFVALRAITDVNPVPPEARGNVRAMADSWIRWGIENCYIEAVNARW